MRMTPLHSSVSIVLKLIIALVFVNLNHHFIFSAIFSSNKMKKKMLSSSISSSSKLRLPTIEQVFGSHGLKPERVDGRIHDVFISFRGEDTRSTFTSYLYSALENSGIKVFIDDNDLQRGDHISTSLSRAIELSQISIIVFSKNYADSRWCLDELERIMKCYRSIGQVVVPVFYHVDPSEVRHQKGEFGIAFQRLLNKILNKVELVQTWRETLCLASNIAGFVILKTRNECDYIKDIVDKVSHLLNKTDLFIANNPVGIESRVEDVIRLLSPQSNRVILLGVWGMGGIGKTTIAKAIYNKIGRNFDCRSFLEDIRKVGETLAGQLSLQEQLLCDIYKERTIKIANINSGKNLLKDILSCREVFIVLDDVSTLDQLNILCGSREWLGLGSIIIITTRDIHLLRGRVDKIYEMTIMNECESLELFSWNAFKQASPKGDFVRISKDVVEYSKGLPLALEVLGSYLFNRTESQWELVLEKLRRIPNVKVQNKLRISYDGLDDDDEQEIFLDIACFFIGMDRDDVILILNDCGLSAEIGISVLVERSLVTIDYKNRLGMHDLLRDMGREIIREKSPRRPEERSRLWFHKDVIDVLSKHTGKGNVTGLALKLAKANAKCFSTKAFENMERLRLLQLDEVKLDGDFENVSRDLRWLSWNGLSHLPTNFYRENLVSIELKNCNFELVWKKTLRMGKLKILNLSHSHHLTQSSDFSNMPNLEKLVLKDCQMLSEVSPSIGQLDKILLINLEDCVSLRSLPRSIYKLKSLKTLILSGCEKIENLEDDLEEMEPLTTPVANKATITRVPFSVVNLKRIGYISFCSSEEGFSRDWFPSIISSWMSPANDLSSHLSFQTFATMSSLVSVDIPSSSSHELSSFSNHDQRLRSLWMDFNSEDQLSVDANLILDALYATNSKELESSATTSQVSNTIASSFIHCCSQVHVSGSKHSLKSLLIQMGMNCQIANILKEIILQNMDVNGSGGCFLPGDSYPNWLTFSSEGSSITFEVPQVKGLNLKTMMCIVYSSTPDNTTSDGLKNVLVKNYTKAAIQLYKKEALVSFEEEEWKRVVSSIEPGNRVEVIFVFENDFIVEKTAVSLVYDKPIGEELELYHVPDLNVIACPDNESESAAKKKKKNRVELKMVKQWLGKYQFFWFLQALQGFLLATMVFHLWLKFLD